MQADICNIVGGVMIKTLILLYFRLNEIYVQVSICNVVRGVMEGKALVSLLADVVEDADPQTIEFLVLVCVMILFCHFQMILFF